MDSYDPGSWPLGSKTSSRRSTGCSHQAVECTLPQRGKDCSGRDSHLGEKKPEELTQQVVTVNTLNITFC